MLYNMVKHANKAHEVYLLPTTGMLARGHSFWCHWKTSACCTPLLCVPGISGRDPHSCRWTLAPFPHALLSLSPLFSTPQSFSTEFPFFLSGHNMSCYKPCLRHPQQPRNTRTFLSQARGVVSTEPLYLRDVPMSNCCYNDLVVCASARVYMAKGNLPCGS